MTEEELTRFALVLREADRIRAQMASHEAAARARATRSRPPRESYPSCPTWSQPPEREAG
jgi:hypothetical protein